MTIEIFLCNINVILKCFKNRLFEIINEQLLGIFLASNEDETDESYESDLKILLKFQLNTITQNNFR